MSKGPRTHPLSLAKKKYSRHRAQARFRNIDFNFSFEDWYEWWLQHGVDKNVHTRWRGPDRLCMCRYGDVGAYEWNNVYCATHIKNVHDRHATNKPYNYDPVYRLGDQLVTHREVKQYLELRGMSSSYQKDLHKDRYLSSAAVFIKRYVKRFHKVYGEAKRRRWFTGKDACYSTRLAAARSWGIEPDKYVRLERRGVEGYTTHTIGNLERYLITHCPHPDIADIARDLGYL